MPSKAPARDARALFVRIPSEDAARLDRAAFELKLSKQDIVAGLVGRYVDPRSRTSLEALRALGRASGPRRVTVELGGEELAVGRHDFRPTPPADVLTLAETAELLRVDEGLLARFAREGELPGRCIGGEWRFARRAILEWLEAGDGAATD